MRNMDELLKEALSPNVEMSVELKQRILKKVGEGKEHNMSNIRNFADRKRRIPVAAAIAVATLMITSVTAFAVWRYLSAGNVALEAENERLAEAFISDEAISGGEVQSCGGYDIAFIGMVSGENLSENLSMQDGKIVDDKTYAVVGISNSDGTAMPETWDEAYDEQEFLISPYIEGYDPNRYNVFTLGGGGNLSIVRNGVWYRIMEVNNIEPFADSTVYLGVTDGIFYNKDAYIFDESNGSIRRNDSYEGVNALFTIPIDRSKADAKKVKEVIGAIDNPDDSMDTGTFFNRSYDTEAEKFMSKLTPENINDYASPIESTRRTITPDADGVYTYSYKLPSGASGTDTQTVSDVFPDGKVGMSKNFGFSADEDGISSLLIETHTLNSDGTVTCVIYRPVVASR